MRKTVQDLREDGHNVRQILDMGYSLQEFKDSWFKNQDLVECGVTADEFFRGGFTIIGLSQFFSAETLKNVGYSVKEMKTEFTEAQLINVGYSLDELYPYKLSDREKNSLSNMEVGYGTKWF